MIRPAFARAALLVLSGALAAALASCSDRALRVIAPHRTAQQLAPAPSTPASAVSLLQYCWQQRSSATYRDLFTDDYHFDFSPGDSAGAAYRDRLWNRADEMIFADHLFVHGSPAGPVYFEPPASAITLDFTSSLIPYGDVRPGKNPTWHEQVRGQYVLRIFRSDNSAFDVTGATLFYLVRGDSAHIPADLLSRGFAPDSNRWWIDGWEDETFVSVPAAVRQGIVLRSQPTRRFTLGALKTLYR